MSDECGGRSSGNSTQRFGRSMISLWSQDSIKFRSWIAFMDPFRTCCRLRSASIYATDFSSLKVWGACRRI